MFGIASIVALAISFLLYALHSSNPSPWDSQGFMLAGLALLAAHLVIRSGPWHKP